MYLIAGLGNPGKQYDGTRHNVGFAVIDLLSEKYNIKVNKIKFKGLCGEGSIAGEKVILLKPQTFMNLSGESVREAASFYKIGPENIIVIYDDVSILVGSLRIRKHGSAGGHNGMKSIIYQLCSDEFCRIRLGIGTAQEREGDLADHVLGRFSKQEAEEVFEAAKTVPDALECIIKTDADTAAGRYNITKK